MPEEHYGFVPFPNQAVERASFEAVAHERWQPGLCHGEWQFELETQSLLMINTGTDENGYPKEDDAVRTFIRSKDPRHLGNPVIPGASLKGMVRAVYEILTHSCLSQISRVYRGRDRNNPGGGNGTLSNPREHWPLNDPGLGLQSCRSNLEICAACRIFGSILPGSNGGMGGNAWKGRVSIGDAMTAPGEKPQLTKAWLPVLATPRPKRRDGSTEYHDYYPDGNMAGRKRYQVLQSTICGDPKERNRHLGGLNPKPAMALKPGQTFHFRVSFTNLSRAERGVLLRCILLEPGQSHLLGSAKAHGWGRCAIRLVSWTEISPDARYRGESGLTKVDPADWPNRMADDLAHAESEGLYLAEAYEQLKPFTQPKTT